MQPLNLPKYNFNIRPKGKGTYEIFDRHRKKFLSLTPEEWVRQNMLAYLIYDKNFPAPLISVESKIDLNLNTNRYDALVYNNQGKPIMLIECKSPSVKINQSAFDQANAYNTQIKAPYILITNGLKHYCCVFIENEAKFEFMQNIPTYNKL